MVDSFKTSRQVSSQPRAPGRAMTDKLSRILEDLCKPSATERRNEGERLLIQYVENESRDLSTEAFSRFLSELQERIKVLIFDKDNNFFKKRGGLLAIDDLVHVKLPQEDAAKITQLAHLLEHFIANNDDQTLLELATQTLGYLIETSGAMASDIVENEVTEAIKWLRHEPHENRRLGAVLLLKVMAERAPAVFNVHVKAFIDNIWHVLRDPRLHYREAAVQALRACLQLMETRQTRYRMKAYLKLFLQAMHGLLQLPQQHAQLTIESVHGSLLVLGEMSLYTGEFLLCRYKEVVEVALRFKDSKEKQIRKAVVVILPRMAKVTPDRFAADYLHKTIQHLLLLLKNAQERGAAFSALADLASTMSKAGLSQGFHFYLSAIGKEIKDTLMAKGKQRVQCPEALQCIGALAKALGEPWKQHVQQLLEPMVLTGLSNTLVAAMRQVAEFVPELLGEIRALLLDLLALILIPDSNRALFFDVCHMSEVSAGSKVKPEVLLGSKQNAELQGPPAVKLALQAFLHFDFGPISLLDFALPVLLPYMDDYDKEIRMLAALACATILKRSVYNDNPRAKTGGKLVQYTRIVDKLLNKLLQAAVADTSERVRIAVFRAFLPLRETHDYKQALAEAMSVDRYLSQVSCLRPLFVATNDESLAVRRMALELLGRLAVWNPAFLNPNMRRHLLQLLNDMEHSPDSKLREESALLLDVLIASFPHLIMPYVEPIQHVLLEKLRDVVSGNASAGGLVKPVAERVPGSSMGQKNTDNSLVKSLLQTVGQLAAVVGPAFQPYAQEFMPLVIEAVQDPSSPSKRIIAVKTLGQVALATGEAMRPYMDFKQLLGVLLRMLHEGNSKQRSEVIRVLGILGALDPWTHKTNQARLSGEGALEKEGVRPLRYKEADLLAPSLPGTYAVALGAMAAAAADEAAADLLPAAGLVTSNDEFYPTVAINALMRVLRDPNMSGQHQNVIKGIIDIFKHLDTSSVQYLPKVMPVLLHVLRTSDEPLREFMLSCMTLLVRSVRQHVRRYLPELLQVVHDYWDACPARCIELMGELVAALRDDVKPFAAGLLAKFVTLLSEAERLTQFGMVAEALSAMEALGGTMEDQLHLLLPALLRLLAPDVVAPLDIRRKALWTVRRLLPRLHVVQFCSVVLLPLIRALEGPEQLRQETLDTICSVAVALKQDFLLFVPHVQKVINRLKAEHRGEWKLDQAWFERLVYKLKHSVAPCMSDASDWDHARNSWALEVDLVREQLGPTTVNHLQEPVAPTPAVASNLGSLQNAWQSSQRVTKEDWREWMRHFSVELLKESPSWPLRACYALAQVQPHMARELFAPAFVSCWNELDENMRHQLVRSMEAALASHTIPAETVTALLNLAEFMEHDDKFLPLESRTLGVFAEKCHAFAKALHYKELEFHKNPHTAVEALIHINNQLRQPEAADGVLTYAQKHLNMELKEGWYEKLGRWDEALVSYESKLAQARRNTREYHTAMLGKVRCLASLAEWERLHDFCKREWWSLDNMWRGEMGVIAAHAAWHLAKWDDMTVYVSALDKIQTKQPNALAIASFLNAVLLVRKGEFEAAQELVDRARDVISPELAALVGESYDRGYRSMIKIQQLTELEEVMQYKRVQEHPSMDPSTRETSLNFIKQRWHNRLRGVQRAVDVWQDLFMVHSLVVPKHEDAHAWLKFASLCRKTQHPKLAERILLDLLGYNPLCGEAPDPQAGLQLGSGPHKLDNRAVMFAYLKYLWSTNKRDVALNRLSLLRLDLETRPEISSPAVSLGPYQASAPLMSQGGVGPSRRTPPQPVRPHPSLKARVSYHLADWLWTANDEHLFDDGNGSLATEILDLLSEAKDTAPTWAGAWAKWARFHLISLEHCWRLKDTAQLGRHAALAAQGLFEAIALGHGCGDKAALLQDILRLLTLWFNHCSTEEMRAVLQQGFDKVSIDTWLAVIPQIIARIHVGNHTVRDMVIYLLCKIGKSHPQALIYPLIVACKSQSSQRRSAAARAVEDIRQHSPALVEQAQLVSQELIRMAILWHEMWFEALEEASRLYFGESNVEGMLQRLLPLHDMMDKKADTLKEQTFIQTYGQELKDAHKWLKAYEASRKEAELHQAWDLYYHVFKKINKQVQSFTVLELNHVAPSLAGEKATSMELAVPGTYIVGEPVVPIASFAPQLHVINSKQRPRKLTIYGGDGAEYQFLLKGHEDLRQDERVMQLFGLVNSLLASEPATAEKDLAIGRYAVIPLSPNCGLIGWVPNTDTLHALIREYRESKKVMLNLEHRLMLQMAQDYEHLLVIQKVEVFEFALDTTSGEDLHKVLWLKSRTSELWLERRTNFTRSTAVMSMVGYLLGLGDRHPSNLMLDRYSGKLLHIDFGDCFEASMNRDKFPEKVPFRLTRMMTKAMEVSGIEGNYRNTCENVMKVLRSNREPVLAMLEAFLFDPLINWRFAEPAPAAEPAPVRESETGMGALAVHLQPVDPTAIPEPPRRDLRERAQRELSRDRDDDDGDQKEVISERAMAMCNVIRAKLAGKDFLIEGRPQSSGGDAVPAQVERLIQQAVSHENLCQSYIGWCPFW